MMHWFQRFMYGRYGTDNLNRLLSIMCLILFILSYFTSGLLYPLAVLLMTYTLFRMFSRNTWKRSRENQAYLNIKGKIIAGINPIKTRYRQRKTHRFFKCRSCRTTLRIPKGRGRVVITCPKCGTNFEGKT